MVSLPNFTIKSKLQASLILVSISSLIVVGYIGWSRSKHILTQTLTHQLTSLRSAKAQEIESYFRELNNQVATLCEDKMIISAMVEFNKSFQELNHGYSLAEWDKDIKKYYEQQFFPKLNLNFNGNSPTFDNYRPISQASRYLQYYYLAKNTFSSEQKDKLDDPKDGSNYSEVHSEYHPILRNLSNRLNYEDLYLINPKTGDIVYSVRKATDFSTNLDRGVYRQTSLAEILNKVRDNPEHGSISVVDFKPYRPSLLKPQLFIAGPIYNGTHLVGVLALRIDYKTINEKLVGTNNWKDNSLGKTGEIYIVGNDNLMRSEARPRVENPESFSRDLHNLGVSDETIKLMNHLQTSILLQFVNTTSTELAFNNQTGTSIISNYYRKQVLSSYSPLNIKGLNWAIIAEVGINESFKPLYILQIYLLIATVIIVFLISLLSQRLSLTFVDPIQKIVQGSKHGETDDLIPITLETQSEFQVLVNLYNELLETIQKDKRMIEDKNKENLILLNSILPSSVVERLNQNQGQRVENLKQTTIMLATINGLTKIIENYDTLTANYLLNELIESLESVAENHEVEKIKTFGDQYILICGLNKTRLDHCKRMMDVALESLEVVNTFSEKHGLNLSLAMGIHMGSVIAGIVGRKKISYHLWGETMLVVKQLNLTADNNSVIISQEVYEHLQELYSFEKGENIKVESVGEIPTWVFRKKWLQNLISQLTDGLGFDED